MIYKLTSIVYVLILCATFVVFPNYILLILLSTLLWLALRGLVFEQLIVGSSALYRPIKGTKARVISLVLLIPLLLGLVLVLKSHPEFNTTAIMVILFYPPLLLLLGKYLKPYPSVSPAKINDSPENKQFS